MQSFLADVLYERPPHLPDLTQRDFFLSGHIKYKVYTSAVAGNEVQKTRITHVIQSIAQSLLENTWIEVEFYLDVVGTTKGARIAIL